MSSQISKMSLNISFKTLALVASLIALRPSTSYADGPTSTELQRMGLISAAVSVSSTVLAFTTPISSTSNMATSVGDSISSIGSGISSTTENLSSTTSSTSSSTGEDKSQAAAGMRDYLQNNQENVLEALAMGAGESIDELGVAFSIQQDERAAFGKLLRSQRKTLSQLSSSEQISLKSASQFIQVIYVGMMNKPELFSASLDALHARL